MVKYTLQHGNSLIEFATMGEASAYKTQHSLSEEIIAVEEEEPGEVPPIMPISSRQIRLQLFSLGITEAMIVEALGSLESPTKEIALIEWEYAVEFDRYNPLVGMVGQMLEWTESQLDDLWILGALL